MIPHLVLPSDSSGRIRWPKDISRPSSRRREGWEWAQTGVFIYAEYVFGFKDLCRQSNSDHSMSLTVTTLVSSSNSNHAIYNLLPGRFAVKKIAVGHSHEYLFRILKEVRLLETLRHPNIVSYHHSWLETTRFSSFGPSIPTLQ